MFLFINHYFHSIYLTKPMYVNVDFETRSWCNKAFSFLFGGVSNLLRWIYIMLYIPFQLELEHA